MSMMTSSPVKLGMIGCGFISHAHGRAAQKSDGKISFTACASRDETRVTEWAKEYGCGAAYTDYRQMLVEEDLDGVVITTWPGQHREHIETALKAGIRFVLCEKALVSSGKDALALRQAAHEAGAVILEGFMYRYHPAMEKVHEIVRSGVLGKIDTIRGVVHMAIAPADAEDKDTRKSWRTSAEEGGGVLYDFTCYPVDALNSLAGAPPRCVQAMGSRMRGDGPLDRLFGHVEYENGVIGLIESSHHAVFSQALEIHGNKVRLSMPIAWSIPGEAVITLTRSPGFLQFDDEIIRIPQPGPHNGSLIDAPVFKLQLDHFAAVIGGEVTPRMTLQESCTNALVLDALLESYKSGRSYDLRHKNACATSELSWG